MLICSQLRAKHLVITQEKDDRVKVVLSYRLQRNFKYRATYDLNVEAIFFAIDRGWHSQLI